MLFYINTGDVISEIFYFRVFAREGRFHLFERIKITGRIVDKYMLLLFTENDGCCVYAVASSPASS